MQGDQTWLRQMSLVCCESSKRCKHFKHAKHHIQGQPRDCSELAADFDEKINAIPARANIDNDVYI
jgi:hypothetical protein